MNKYRKQDINVLMFKTLQTEGHSKVVGLMDIQEFCGTDGHSRVAGQTDIPELRDWRIFQSCGTDGHCIVAGLMDIPELRD